MGVSHSACASLIYRLLVKITYAAWRELFLLLSLTRPSRTDLARGIPDESFLAEAEVEEWPDAAGGCRAVGSSRSTGVQGVQGVRGVQGEQTLSILVLLVLLYSL